MDGWMDWDWDGSPGGRGYRAPYGANKGQNGSLEMKMIFLKLQALKKPDQKGFLVSSFVPQWYFAVDFFLFHAAVFSVTINHSSRGSLIYTMLSAKV